MDISHSDSRVQSILGWLGSGSINIFGWPFSGKDTQGRRLAQLFNAPLIGGGDILRNRENVPEHVRKAIDVGLLAPTDEFMQIVVPYLNNPEYTGRPLVLSSLGRWQGEEESIVTVATTAKHPIKAVINLVLDQQTAQKRAKLSKRLADRGQRADDAKEYLSTRYNEFKTKTLPVIDFYQQKGLLIEIDGKLSPDAVTQQIIDKLAHLAQTA